MRVFLPKLHEITSNKFIKPLKCTSNYEVNQKCNLCFLSYFITLWTKLVATLKFKWMIFLKFFKCCSVSGVEPFRMMKNPYKNHNAYIYHSHSVHKPIKTFCSIQPSTKTLGLTHWHILDICHLTSTWKLCSLSLLASYHWGMRWELHKHQVNAQVINLPELPTIMILH